MLSLVPFYAEGRLTMTALLLFPILWVFSGVYAAAVFCVRQSYRKGFIRPWRSKSRVISVGNITLGGSGKTPFVEFLARRLSERGHKVAILLRGYKRPAIGAASGKTDFYRLGDEGSLLKENCGQTVSVYAHTDRVAVARQLDQQGSCDVLVLDDGFQHWRMERDLDIVTLDARRPFGNGLLLPAGQLRETRGALGRAHLFCLTRCDLASPEAITALENHLRKINPRAAIARSLHEPKFFYDLKIKTEFKLSFVRQVSVGVLCGIGAPSTFETTLKNLGASIVEKKFFADHHVYSQRDILMFAARCRKAGVRLIVTTQKDAQRLKDLVRHLDLGVDVVVLKIGLKVTRGLEEIDARLDTLFHF